MQDTFARENELVTTRIRMQPRAWSIRCTMGGWGLKIDNNDDSILPGPKAKALEMLHTT